MALALTAHLNQAIVVRADSARALALVQPAPLLDGSVAWRTARSRALALLSGAWMASVAQRNKMRRAQRQQGWTSRAATKRPRGFGNDSRKKKVVLDFKKLMQMAQTADDAKQKEIERRIDAGYGTFTWSYMQQLRSALLEPDNGAAQRIADALSLATKKRMEPATKKLQEIIDRVSLEDGSFIKEVIDTVRKAESPIPFLAAMETAIGQYEQMGMMDEHRGLEMVRQAVAEALDKEYNPTGVFLSRVVAEKDSSKRDALLRQLLEPSDWSSEESNPEHAASVLTSSFTSMVEKLLIEKSLDDDERNASMEHVRTVAKETRMVMAELRSEAELQLFSKGLSPIFKKCHEWKKQWQQRQLHEQAWQQ